MEDKSPMTEDKHRALMTNIIKQMPFPDDMRAVVEPQLLNAIPELFKMFTENDVQASAALKAKLDKNPELDREAEKAKMAVRVLQATTQKLNILISKYMEEALNTLEEKDLEHLSKEEIGMVSKQIMEPKNMKEAMTVSTTELFVDREESAFLMQQSKIPGSHTAEALSFVASLGNKTSDAWIKKVLEEEAALAVKK